MTKLLFLGTGAADWNMKTDIDNPDFRGLSGILIDGHIMIDCGPGAFLYKDRNNIPDLFDNVDSVFITHSHEDHMEERTIRALCNTDITWVVPSFLADDMMRFGVRRHRIITVEPNDRITVGPLNVRVLEGKHFRPDTGAGIDAVGYLISSDKGPSLAFPGDIRDYSVSEETRLEADHCFGHVWLTDEALDPDKYIPKAEELAEFLLNNSRKSILLAHLYSDRSDDKRWTLMHARIVREKINKLSPETRVHVPRYGEIFELS